LLIELPSKCSTLTSKVEYHPNIKLKHLFLEKNMDLETHKIIHIREENLIVYQSP
jgi:hypothetical protein